MCPDMYSDFGLDICSGMRDTWLNKATIEGLPCIQMNSNQQSWDVATAEETVGIPRDAWLVDGSALLFGP